MTIVALDTETSLMGPGCQVPLMVCVSYAVNDEMDSRGLLHHTDPRALDFVRGVLEKEEEIVFANPSFDLAVFIRWKPELWPVIEKALEEDRIKDVQVREKLIDILMGSLKKSYSLKSLANRYDMAELDKDTWRLCYHRLYHKHLDEWPQGAVKYAVDDALTTLAIYTKQRELEDSCPEGIFDDEGFQNRAAFALHLTACWGLRVDKQKFDALSDALKKTRDQLLITLQEVGFMRLDGTRDTHLVQSYVKQKYAAGMAMRQDVPCTPTGAVSLSEEALGYLDYDKHILAYQEYGKINSFITKDLLSLSKGVEEPIHTRFDTLRETGRTSSFSPNIQNLPRHPYEIRETITPRDGCVFVVSDYCAAELHALAQACLHLGVKSQLANFLNSGRDPHLAVALQLLGNACSYEEAERWIQGENGEEWKARLLEARQLAKICNFGYAGGMGSARFVDYAKGYGVTISQARSEELRNDWKKAIPEIADYFRAVRESAVDSNGKTTFRLRHRPGGRLRTCTSYTSACNYKFQAIASDGAKKSCWNVTKAQLNPGSPLSGTSLVAFIHDELVIEAPTGIARECADALTDIMVQSYNEFVPDVPCRAETYLTTCLSKRAYAVYTQDSFLKPWTPPKKDNKHET